MKTKLLRRLRRKAKKIHFGYDGVYVFIKNKDRRISRVGSYFEVLPMIKNGTINDMLSDYRRRYISSLLSDIRINRFIKDFLKS